MLSKNLLFTTLVIVLMYAPATFSQMAPSSPGFTEQQSTLSIHEGNLYCFQNIRCLQSEKPFRNTDLSNIELNGSTETYVLEGKTRNEELYAEYNGRNGNLIKATVIQRNIILPKQMLAHLATGEYSGWTMVGNQRVIKNFQKDSIRYEVMMMKDGELRIEYFDRHGESTSQIS